MFDEILRIKKVSAGNQPFKRQFRKMVKHPQIIRRQFTDELFEFV